MIVFEFDLLLQAQKGSSILQSEDKMDDGTVISLNISINEEARLTSLKCSILSGLENF